MNDRLLAALPPRERAIKVARSIATTVVVITLLLLAYALSPAEGAGGAQIGVRVVVSIAFLGLAVLIALRSVLKADLPMLRAVEALAMVIALMLVIFASVYLAMSTASAEAFSEPLGRVDAFYFTLTTSTTVGFGDISPLSTSARVVTMVQMVANVVIIGVVARLLIQSAQRRTDAD